MLQWFAENVEGLLALLTIAAAVVSLLVKAGAIQKGRGDVLTQVLEDSAGATERIIKALKIKKMRAGSVPPTDEEIAAAIAKGLKGEARERAIKTGLRSVVAAVADGAAAVDPRKVAPGPLRRFGRVLRARLRDPSPNRP